MKAYSVQNSLDALYEAFLGGSSSPLSRLNVVAKLALLVLAIVIAPFSGSPYGLLALVLVSAVTLAASRRPGTLINCAVGLRWVLLLIAVVTGVVDYLSGYSVVAAVADSLILCLRVLLLLTLFSVVSSALTVYEVLRLADRLMVPKSVAYSFVLAIRFIPLILNDVGEVSASLKLKGLSLGEGGLADRVRALTRLLTALVIVVSFRRFKVAEAILLRGLLDE